MILYEFEAKKMLQDAGITVPKSELIKHHQEPARIYPPFVLKAQLLSGKRKEAGGIVFVNDSADFKAAASSVFGLNVKGETVKNIL